MLFTVVFSAPFSAILYECELPLAAAPLRFRGAQAPVHSDVRLRGGGPYAYPSPGENGEKMALAKLSPLRTPLISLVKADGIVSTTCSFCTVSVWPTGSRVPSPL